MALRSLIMGYVLRKVTNPTSKVFNRWFAWVDYRGALSTRALAEHMIEHGMIGNKAEVLAMLSKLSECIPELVAQGYGVKLDGIGIFKPYIKNKKGGAASVEDFNVNTNIKGVRFGFEADSTDLDNLTTKAFGKKVSFGQGYYQTENAPHAPKYPIAAASDEPEP